MMHRCSGQTNNQPVSNRALAHQDYSAQARYTVSYVPENQKIERDMQIDDADIAKPARGDKLITARTLAYERNDVNAARSANARLMRSREVRRQYR